MAPIEQELTQLLSLLKRKVQLKGLTRESQVVSTATAELIQEGYDNWNGGQYYYTLYLDVSIEILVEIESQLEEVESTLLEEAKSVRRGASNEHISEVKIRPAAEAAVPGIPLSEANVREVSASLWAPNTFRIFISHVSAKKSAAHALRQALLEFGISAFVAHDDIEPTKEWQDTIETALRTMDALTALISDGFIESKWCDQETGIAMGMEKLVIPIRLGADPHGFLGKYQALPGMGIDVKSVAQNVFDILRKHPATRLKMSPVLVNRFINSNSYAQARERVLLLDEIPTLSKEHAEALRNSVHENGQIEHAFGVPEAISSLLSRQGYGLET